MYAVRDKANVTTRERTPEGFLRGSAVVTRTGILEYEASELGLTPPGRIRIRQTPDSVFHPETLRSAQNAPVTIDHPNGGVTPGSYRELSVGSVGTPRPIGEDKLGADIFFGDGVAIDMVDRGGVDQLSIGKSFGLRKTADGTSDYETVGPIHINHIAVVSRGTGWPGCAGA